MKRLTVILAALLLPLTAAAQITIEACYDSARANYPLIVRYDLIEKTKQYSLRNAALAYVPKFSISGQATYQSDVTALPFSIPGYSIDPIPKDQYKAVAELQQAIWDGGAVRAERKNIMASTEVEKRSLDVDLYAIRERVNQLFFGIMLFDRQIELNDLYNDELWRNFRNVESYVDGGLANAADLDAVSVEILVNSQNRSALVASREAYCGMLSALTGVKIDKIAPPSVIPTVDSRTINRPEIELFDAQKTLADARRYAISAKGLPRIGLFAQGAYGNPGLNFLQAGFTPYAIGGVRVTWDFSGWYSAANDKKLIELQKRNIDAIQETFLFNTRLDLQRNEGEIKRLRAQMDDDDRIIKLRNNITRAAEARVEGGTITVTDMMREVTAENQARLTKSLHEVELLMEIYNIRYKTNN